MDGRKREKIIFSANERQKRNQDIALTVLWTAILLFLSHKSFGTRDDAHCILSNSTYEMVLCQQKQGL